MVWLNDDVSNFFVPLLVTLSTCTSLHCHLEQSMTRPLPSTNNLSTVSHVLWVSVLYIHRYSRNSLHARQLRRESPSSWTHGHSDHCRRNQQWHVDNIVQWVISYLKLSLLSGQEPSFPCSVMSILACVMIPVNACKIYHHSQTRSFPHIEIELSSRYAHPPNSPSLHSSSPQEAMQKCYSAATALSPHTYSRRSRTPSTLTCRCCPHQLLWRCWTWYPYSLLRLHRPRTFASPQPNWWWIVGIRLRPRTDNYNLSHGSPCEWINVCKNIILSSCLSFWTYWCKEGTSTPEGQGYGMCWPHW